MSRCVPKVLQSASFRRHDRVSCGTRRPALRAPTRTVGRATLSLCAPRAAGSAGRRAGRIESGSSALPRAALAAREQAALLQLYAIEHEPRPGARRAGATSSAALAAARRDRRRRPPPAAAWLGGRSRSRRRTSASSSARSTSRATPDALAVIFGATSLDEIITGFDGLSRAATSTERRDRADDAGAARGQPPARLAEPTGGPARAAARRRGDAEADELAARAGGALGVHRPAARRAAADGAADRRPRGTGTGGRGGVDRRHRQGTDGRRASRSLGAATAPERDSPPPTRLRRRPRAPAAPAPIQPASGSGKQLTVVATAYSLPRWHRERTPDRARRRRRRPDGHPARHAPVHSRLRPGHRRRHRHGDQGPADRPVVPDAEQAERVGQAHGHDHASADRAPAPSRSSSPRWRAAPRRRRRRRPRSRAGLGAKLDAALHAPGIGPSRTGAMAVDLASGRVLFAHNSAVGFVPASNEKLPVTYAALTAARAGVPLPDRGARPGHRCGADGTWSGNLVLKGYGDPDAVARPGCSDSRRPRPPARDHARDRAW